jgi:hypothetical protein
MQKLSVISLFFVVSTLVSSVFLTSSVLAEGRSLQKEMSSDAFKAAGLHKLDAAELQALEAWLTSEDSASGELEVVGAAKVEPKEAPGAKSRITQTSLSVIKKNEPRKLSLVRNS